MIFLKFIYVGNQKDGTNLKVAFIELKNSWKYLIQSAGGRDNISSFLRRLSEYGDSVIVKNIDNGKEFHDGTCTLKINEKNAEIIDVIMSFRFQNKKLGLEEYRYSNQVKKQSFTDEAYEELLDKTAMSFEMVR